VSAEGKYLRTLLAHWQHSTAADRHRHCTADWDQHSRPADQLDKPADSRHPTCLVARDWPLPVHANMSQLKTHAHRCTGYSRSWRHPVLKCIAYCFLWSHELWLSPSCSLPVAVAEASAVGKDVEHPELAAACSVLAELLSPLDHRQATLHCLHGSCPL